MRSVPSINYFLSIRHICLVALAFTWPFISSSQKADSLPEKLSITLRKAPPGHDNNLYDFVIVVGDNDAFKGFLVNQAGVILRGHYPATKTWVIRASKKRILETFLPRSEVLFIDRQQTPVEEVAVSNLDISADRVNLVHRLYPQLDGQSLTVSIKEHRPDTNDIDIRGRYIHASLASSQMSSHATIMATIIAGAGNTYYEGRGAARAARLTSFSFLNLLPENDATYQQYSISVQNHSYGTGIENYYGAEAMAYDASVIIRPTLLHVFSAGNSGLQTPTTGIYSGINGYANLTGNFKMGKNIITVGHVDSFSNVLPPSSRGPAYDGRVKPELVAYGSEGSSGAAAIVSGIALLVQQTYRDIYGNLPPAGLVKACLINAANDVANRGIDFVSGYGQANAIGAVQTIMSGQFFTGSVSTGATNDHVLIIPSNIRRAKLTLAWIDPPASASAQKALRNDLDIELIYPASGQTWQPWVLSHFPHADSLSKLPVRKRDSLNLVEQISLDDPTPGNYILRVRGFSVTVSSSQSYFIAYSFDTAQSFKWNYPTRTDNLFPGRANVLRWQSHFNSTGQLEWSADNGSSWQLIAANVDLSQGYFKWTPPVNFETVLLRMNVAAQFFLSDTITVSDRIDVNVGFNCPDSFALWWNRVPGITNYQLYRLGNLYMEPFLQTTDTLVVLNKQTNPSLYYAVSPVIDGKLGLRSYAYDYTVQGVGCYIKTFLALLNNNNGELYLQLGTTYNILSITWEKFTGTGFSDLATITSLQSLQYSYTDNSLKKGLNVYRVRIELVNGQVIYSQPESIYYFDKSIYLLYPNPVRRGGSVNLVNGEAGIINVQLINASGEIVFETESAEQVINLPTSTLSTGIYYLRVFKEDNTKTVMKLLVL